MTNQVEELKKIARGADKVDKERADTMASLVKHPGWAIYMAVLGVKLQETSELMLAPEQELLATGVNTEFVKGTMRGLLIAQGLPSVMIEGKEELKNSDPAKEIDE